MTRKRDGPAPRKTTPGQGQRDDERAPPLPGLKTPRNTRALPTPSQSRSRPRQPHPAGWRQFSVRVVTGPDSEAVHALHAFLRAAAKRYGLTIVRIDKVGDDKSE